MTKVEIRSDSNLKIVNQSKKKLPLFIYFSFNATQTRETYFI